MKIEIKSVFGSVLYESDKSNLKEALEEAVNNKVNLYGANLDGANLYGANLSRAKLSRANLSRANLDGANLHGAIKTPIHCKWGYGVTGDKIHIGCEKRTIQEWDMFFDSKEIIETKRGTQEFKQIEAVYRALKTYYEHLKN